MLYRKNENEIVSTEKEQFDIIHFATIILLILLIVIAVTSPEILRENILNISKDFGITL
ncbi:MAG: hypothetical protein HYZ33_02550, partial [Ignavibacteriales bacterium]|nr:hypothetical protein [Ignavibacteriales bacterium]